MRKFAREWWNRRAQGWHPALREAAGTVLQEGDSLSSLIETSVRERIGRRRMRADFVARGLASRDEARRTGAHVEPAAAHAGLGRMLDKARRRVAG